MTTTPKPFANTPQFYAALGWFHAVWSGTELNIDYAIGRLKKMPPEQTHALVAGLRFSDKIKMLKQLLSKSDYGNVSELEQYLTRIESNSLRNTFSHSFLVSNSNTVAFVHRRSNRGQYLCEGYRFAADNFFAHVQEFVQLSHDFERALGFSAKEIGDFAAAAITEEKEG